MSEGKNVGVVFLQMGGPSSLKEVKPFLRELFKDPDLIKFPKLMRPFQPVMARIIAHFRAKGTMEMYSRIGNGSPILRITSSFVDAVATQLQSLGLKSILTTYAMRYSKPRASDVVPLLQEEKISHVLLFPLYPHFSFSTTGSSFKDMERALRHLDITISRINDWGNADFYINWWVQEIQKLRAQLSSVPPEETHLLFTVHGLPKKYIEQGDPYHERVLEAARAIVNALPDTPEWTLAFQSRVGPLEWLQPYTDEVIMELARKKKTTLIVVPLGFVSDHIETLYEIDLLYRDLATEHGIKNFVRVPVPNDHPVFAKGVANLIKEALEKNDP